jgi:predicted TIM-barrel fold metal-dependent hydrolase
VRLFDANCAVGPHIRRERGWRVDTVEDLEEELEYFGIEEALVCHTRAAERDIDVGNGAIHRLLNGHTRLRPAEVVPMHTAVDYPDPADHVARMLETGVRAVRVWPPPYHGYLADSWALGPLWDELAAHRVPVLVGASDLGRYPDQPGTGFSARNLYDVCRTYPTLPVVVIRLNFSAVRVAVPLMRQCPNLYVELSFFTTHRGVELLASEVGAERLLFGSGLPAASPGPAVAALQYAPVADEQRAMIGRENLRGLLGAVGS